jgi:DNA-binding NarL/FixJ family response regulator
VSLARRLLIVEDEPLTSALLSNVLGTHDFEIATATSVSAARRKLRSFDPDIALVDLLLGSGPSGIDLAQVIHRKYPHIGVVLLTRFPSLESAGYDRSSLPPGCGFLRKDQIGDADTIVEAIDAVVAEQANRVRQDLADDRPLAALTPSQIEVLRMMAIGYDNAAIARRRDCSVSAVQQLILGIYRRLEIDPEDEINPRVEAIRRFIAVAGIPERR